MGKSLLSRARMEALNDPFSLFARVFMERRIDFEFFQEEYPGKKILKGQTHIQSYEGNHLKKGYWIYDLDPKMAKDYILSQDKGKYEIYLNNRLVLLREDRVTVLSE